MHAMSEKLYKDAAAASGAVQQGAEPQNDAPDMGGKGDDADVVDADYKEV